MENPVGQVKNIVEIQNTRNIKDKVLENLVSDKYASIDITILSKSGFIDKAIRIFTE